jgi:hypothetical protein
MRPAIAALLLTAVSLAGCASYAGQPYQRTARNEADLRHELAGKVPGRPVDCLQTPHSNNMQVIDDRTILFHDGSTVYVQSPAGGCSPLGSSGYTLVTQSYGGMGLCRGDIARVVDLTGGGFTVGSCSLGEFVPYEKPRRG